MAIPVILAILLLLMLIRVKIHADLMVADGIVLIFGVSYIGITKNWTIRSSQHGMLLEDYDGQRIFHPASMHGRLSFMWRTIKRSNMARRLLMRAIELHQLTCIARVHSHDAARTAVLTGTLRTLYGFLPQRIRRRSLLHVMPEFRDIPSAAQLRCIISCRTGILFITAALLGIASLRERSVAGKEE